MQNVTGSYKKESVKEKKKFKCRQIWTRKKWYLEFGQLKF